MSFVWTLFIEGRHVVRPVATALVVMASAWSLHGQSDEQPAALHGPGEMNARPVSRQFEVLGPFSADGMAKFRLPGDDQWGFVDTSGQVVQRPSWDATRGYSDGLAAVQTDGQWGYIDMRGNIAIRPNFDSAGDFECGLALVTDGGQQIFIDRYGHERIRINQDEWAMPYSEGLAAIRIDNLWGFMNLSGDVTIVPQYDDVDEFSEGRAAVRVGGKWGYIDRAGRVVIPPGYDGAVRFSGGLAGVDTTREEDMGRQYKVIDAFGNVVLNPKDSGLLHFSEGLSFASRPDGPGIGFVDTTGRMRFSDPTWTQVSAFREGYAVVKSGDRWGVINSRGEYVVKPQSRAIQNVRHGSFGAGDASGWRVYMLTSKHNGDEGGERVDKGSGVDN